MIGKKSHQRCSCYFCYCTNEWTKKSQQCATNICLISLCNLQNILWLKDIRSFRSIISELFYRYCCAARFSIKQLFCQGNSIWLSLTEIWKAALPEHLLLLLFGIAKKNSQKNHIITLLLSMFLVWHISWSFSTPIFCSWFFLWGSRSSGPLRTTKMQQVNALCCKNTKNQQFCKSFIITWVFIVFTDFIPHSFTICNYVTRTQQPTSSRT